MPDRRVPDHDEELEAQLRRWFAARSEPWAPYSLRDFLERVIASGDATPRAPSPQSRRRRWWMVATAAVLLLALAGFGVSRLITPAPGRLPNPIPSGTANPASSSPDASTDATATAQPTPTATLPQPVAVAWPTVAPSQASVPPSLTEQDFAFWTLYRPPHCCGSTLRVSTSTGSWEGVFDIPDPVSNVGFTAPPAGPAGGKVVYVVDDNGTEHLMLADARMGTDTELTTTGQVIGLLVIDPSGSTAYYMLFDRRTSSFGGLWAIPTHGGQPRPLVAFQATTAMATLAAERVYLPQLAISNDGTWIAFVTCPANNCELHAFHPDGTAAVPDLRNFHNGDHIVGVAGDLLIGWSEECGRPTCDGFALDLRTGERWPLGGADHPFTPTQLIAGPRGPLLLSESAQYDQGLWRVDTLDLTDGSRSSAFRTTFQPTATIHLAANYLGWSSLGGAELPPGWFLIYRFTNTDALLLPPDYSAARVGSALETRLPFMDSTHP